ncbi:IS4 family transposase [Reichenbachiella versicolor]|uniref:IS4 family transposase n=1 Tax=Reichenbachiella versicolor TaxID=1821036 RepID=UPI0013A59170|nr:IS4 family transposase [Reichenbachiella versicolor]
MAVLQKKLFDFISNPETELKYKQSPKDFSRTSKLSFQAVVGSILHLFKESVEYNLHVVLPSLCAQHVTGSAFSQARYKVKSLFFNDLLTLLKNSYQCLDKKLWKGYLLLAGDGSTLNLPASDDISEKFGIHATNNLGINRYLARIFFLYDVLNDYVVESKLSVMKQGEKTLLEQCLPEQSEGDEMIILDRGFGNFCMIKELTKRSFQYCIRLGVDNSNFAKRAMEDERSDYVTNWIPSPKEKENCRKNGLDSDPILVRVTKIRLSSTEMELLITSLHDQRTYTKDDLKELYHLRWGVEEGFKNLKPKMKIEHFGCKKTEGVYQEFYAHIFHINMISLLGIACQKGIKKKISKRKINYKFNWKNAYRFLRANVIKLLFQNNPKKLVDDLISKITNSLIAVKPNRQFARDTRNLNRRNRISQFNK